MIDPIDLYSTLTRIPFLKLGTIDNVDEIIAQLDDYKDSIQYQKFIQEQIGKALGTDGFMGCYLSPIYENEMYQFGSTSETNIKDIATAVSAHPDRWPEFTLQPLGRDCNLIRQVVDDIQDTPASNRLSLLKAHTSVEWHQHTFIKFIPNCTEVVLHVPLITTKDVVAKVKVYMGDGEEKTHTQHFAKGELWYLNAYHWHIFDNPSDHDRYHIWMNCYLNTPDGKRINHKLNALLEEKVRAYRGPFLAEGWKRAADK